MRWYTQLGMAALLPHEQLCYQPGNGDIVYADGLSTSGIPNRDTILKNYKGMAIKSKDLLELKNQEGRDLIRDYEVVYNRAEMSPEAAGIAACLMTYSHHACRTECYAMTVHYYRLRDYALQHPECSAIMRIID